MPTEKIIYKEESFEIIGCCFEVFNKLGYGLREKSYQKALEEVLSQRGIKYISQLLIPLEVNNKIVSRYYLDLLVNNIIAVELKVGDHFLRKDIEQLLSYLKSRDLKLGILVNFTPKGVHFKRILNLYDS